MGYELRKRKRRDGSVAWLLYFREWQGTEKKQDRYIPKEALLQHGFHPDMAIEEAKARVSQLNSLKQAEKKEERRKVKILAEARARAEIRSVHLPPAFMDEFENIYLKQEVGNGTNGYYRYKKTLCHWEAAKKAILAVDVPIEDFNFRAKSFYEYFRKESYSYEYCRKVIRVLNLWGIFLARKTGGSFLEIPTPPKVEKEAIVDSWLDNGNRSTASLPLTPEALESARDKLLPEQYRWLYISVWLGLRPNEIDRLQQPNSVREEKDQNGVVVLWVYQPKLVTLPREERYKPIPLIYPEQRAVLSMLDQPLKRPLVKTLQKHIKDGITTYGGRKGFVDLMLSKGQDIADISIWMGHRQITTTWGPYKNKKKFGYKLA